MRATQNRNPRPAPPARDPPDPGAPDGGARWVRRLRAARRARRRLFCFPYAGGGAAPFSDWPAGLPDDLEVCPVQLPGRESRLTEPPAASLPDLLAALGPALAPYLDLPFAFFGYSMGALIAFELARWLRTWDGRAPGQLFVAACAAPQLPAGRAPIHRLPEGAFVDALRALNGSAEGALRDPAILRLHLPLLRADFALAETYAYSPAAPLACPVSAFGGLLDEDVGQGELLAWAEQTGGRFLLRLLPGDHFFLRHPAARRSLLHALSEDLAAL